MSNYTMLLTGLALFSLLSLLVMLLVVGRVLVHLPADYFSNPARRRERRYLQFFPVWLRPAVPLGKNLIGLLLVALGVALLVLPGQGLLTLLVGVMLMDFPGKFTCERWLLSRPQVLRAINWLRHRAGERDLIIS